MDRIKDSIMHYWSHRAPDFAQQRVREFESVKRERWLAEFKRETFDMPINVAKVDPLR